MIARPTGALALALMQALVLALPAQAEDCPAVTPPVADLTIDRYYEDGAGSVVEPVRMEAHKAQVAPLKEFVGTVTRLADRAHRQRSSPSGTIACALTWLRGWAQGGAYLGTMNSKQAEAQRKWDLAGTSLAYVKLRRWAKADDREVIEPWLSKWADAARAAFDDPGIKRNNHWYWLGLAQMGVAIATDDAQRWQMAKAIFEDALADIKPEGTLPLEMARGARALHYHVFATEPLVVTAELAAARGEDWYALKAGALHRLVKTTAEGLREPAIFDKLAGVAQQRPVKTGYGWAELYRDRFFDRMPERIEQPQGHRYLGGDTDVLMKAAARK
jgi:poly(beta-D-mannuronate) lyase